MKRFSWLTYLMVICASWAISQNRAPWSVTPYPNSVNFASGTFSFKTGINFSNPDSISVPTLTFFKDRFAELGIDEVPEAKANLILNLHPEKNGNPEAYELEITPIRIRINASSEKGIFYGLITVYQELLFSGKLEVQVAQIQDTPRFSYRGYMLDESRHFFGKEKVKQLLDMMALFKLNTFHWHLTDENGWRIAIRSFPLLGDVGGIGNKSDPEAPAQFYSQADIREIVAYAKIRQIEIIPEIDMPGHATAANRAYPEFSGGGSKNYPEFTFNPGAEATYDFLKKILEEVGELFPSKYIHLGGDEVHFGNENWNRLPAVQSLMQDQELTSLMEVEHHFMERMETILEIQGKRLAGWDEIIESKVSKVNSRVYWWRHDKPEQLQKALEKGYNTILCPRLPLYFDFVQFDRDSIGRRWKGFSSLEGVYGYPDNTHEFLAEEYHRIAGIQANLWTEVIASSERFDYMTYPRILALAESGWTLPEHKDLSRFYASLPVVYAFLDKSGISYFNALNPELTPEPLR